MLKVHYVTFFYRPVNKETELLMQEIMQELAWLLDVL